MGYAAKLGLFQPTLPRRERPPWRWESMAPTPCFNPRSREGSDSGFHAIDAASMPVSTHAPAKGATCAFSGSAMDQSFQPTLPRRERQRIPRDRRGFNASFNPRSREGSDPKIPTNCHGRSKFQPTLPRRERHRWLPIPSYGTSFNPRSREGSDLEPPALTTSSRSFNPRSREGSDQAGRGDLPMARIVSTHAPAKGATTSPTLT